MEHGLIKENKNASVIREWIGFIVIQKPQKELLKMLTLVGVKEVNDYL
jgi:hypothetical protein